MIVINHVIVRCEKYLIIVYHQMYCCYECFHKMSFVLI